MKMTKFNQKLQKSQEKEIDIVLLEYTHCISCRRVIPPPTPHKKSVLGMALNYVWWWGSSCVDLKNV